jgi:hypothetical protein
LDAQAAEVPTLTKEITVEVELKLDGETVVKATVNFAALLAKLQSSVASTIVDRADGDEASETRQHKSSPLTKAEAEKLLRNIHRSSAKFLKKIAENGGSITWGEMRTIFKIEDPTDWPSFSGGYGKGITRTLRHLLNDETARLVWWDDRDPSWGDFDNGRGDEGKVYIDGPALDALREARMPLLMKPRPGRSEPAA